MKKHDEGYILAYVTVAILIFCLVATTILTGAMQNLENQQNVIAQMEDQYAAEGMIEQVVAQLENWNFEEGTEVGNTGVICITREDGTVTLSATHGAVTITCEVRIGDGKYLSYEIGGAAE